MKINKLLGILVLGLLLSGNTFADVEELPRGTTVNSLIQNGYKLIDTDSVAWADNDGYGSTGTFYHLMKGKNLVTCGVGNNKISCWKP